MSTKLNSIKSCRSLASEITDSGAKLYDLLGRENELKVSRQKAIQFLDNISRNLDSNAEQEYIEKCIKDLIIQQKEQLTQMEKMVRSLEQDEKNLESKIKKRGGELERAEKRMKSLQHVRPAFMDE